MFKRYGNNKATSRMLIVALQITLDTDRSTVPFHHRLHVAQSQPEPLHIMYVPGRHPVEPIKYLALFLLGNAYPIVAYLNGKELRVTSGSDLYHGRNRAVLHRIVDQVVEDAGEVGAVSAHVGQFRLGFEADPPSPLFSLEGAIADHLGE